MKIALLKYTFMFDPSNTWSNGYKFESQLADFFAAYGYEAEIVEPRGGSGERIIVLTNIDPLNQVKDMKNDKASFKKQTDPQKILNDMKPEAPTNDFKTYINSTSKVNQPQKITYQPGSKINAQKIKKPLTVKFRGGK